MNGRVQWVVGKDVHKQFFPPFPMTGTLPIQRWSLIPHLLKAISDGLLTSE